MRANRYEQLYSVRTKSHENIIYFYVRLTSVKILNSIVLLGLSSNYVTDKISNVNENTPNTETSSSSSDLQLPITKSLEKDQNKVEVPKPRPVKALNEIDRYTLCSNRIV